uniref:Protein kinase domain-containing protein n=1 Tax=Alexandrium catenella TaxID=2925 RepID=A0A7S1SEZ8_ALECA
MEAKDECQVPRCMRAVSSCSTSLTQPHSSACSSRQASQLDTKEYGSRSRSTSSFSDQARGQFLDEPSWCSKLSERDSDTTHFTDPSPRAESKQVPWQAVPHEQKGAPDSSARTGCVFAGTFFEWFCKRLWRSDLLEYNFAALDKVADLGQGTFGKVTLVWCSQTAQCLALKAVSKAMLTQRKLQNATRQEKTIMRRMDSPFLVRLAATFNGDHHLYILMEAARGGDLHEVYGKEKLWGLQGHARFYSACMVSALEYMHSRCIIYRDLKMENVVLSHKGYAKLCDFGLARFLWPSIGSAYTICGTSEYKAPEINTRTGYRSAVDWWALGILLYELVMGNTPFSAESAEEVETRATLGIGEIIPEADARPWCNLVRELCQLEPSDRLPVRHGIDALRQHDWFQDVTFDWDSLHRGCLMVPYDPQLGDVRAIGHFGPKKDAGTEEPGFVCETEMAWAEDYEDTAGPYVMEELSSS